MNFWSRQEGSLHRLMGQPQIPPVPSWVGGCAGSRGVPWVLTGQALAAYLCTSLPEKQELFRTGEGTRLLEGTSRIFSHWPRAGANHPH